MTKLKIWTSYSGCAMLLLVIAGCGKSGPEIAPVSGRIMLNGQPLENADIVFQPDNSKPPSTGRTDADGHYELIYKRGQMGGMVGQNTVRITVSGELVKNPPRIAAKYNTQSELRREVTSGKNDFDFDVTVEGK